MTKATMALDALYATNPLERLNKEVKRRTNVIGVFPDVAAAIRLVGAMFQEIDDEWHAGRRYVSLESMQKLYHEEALTLPCDRTRRVASVH